MTGVRLRTPAQLRVREDQLEPAEAQFPELLSPLARAVHHSKCPVCLSNMHGFEDLGDDGKTVVQLSCFGDPPHVFLFGSGDGHIDSQPSAFGQLRSADG